MDEVKIKTKINSLESSYRTFVIGNTPTIIAEEFGRGYGFDEETTEILATGVFFLLIFVVDEEQFITFISQGCSIPREEAASLFWGIVEALPEPHKTQFLLTKHELDTHTATSTSDLASQISEAEAAIATLPTIRTMNQTEPVYSSTQAAILREGGEVGAGSALPKTQPSEAPTWDSAR